MAPRSTTPGRSRPLSLLPLEDRTVPATAFVLSGNTLLTLDTANPAAAVGPVALSGLEAGETLVGIDVRPVNGVLYGLGVDPATDRATLYAISPRTGEATPVGGGGSIELADAGGAGRELPDPALAGVGYGVDFNPVADRLRVVAGNLNFRVDPNTGRVVDTNPGTAGSQADFDINGGSNFVTGAAYTNNSPFAARTTQYTLDAAADRLLIQRPLNSGTQVDQFPVTVAGGAALDFDAVHGFDIPPGVDAPIAGDPAAGRAFAALTVAGVPGLYSIELGSGVAARVGPIGDGTAAATGLAVWGDQTGPPAVALSADGTQLAQLVTGTPGAAGSVAVTGVDGAEVLVGVDYRPATGQLYGLGVSAAGTGTVYLIDPRGGAATPVAAVGSVALADGTGAARPLPDSAATGYGFDFDPAADLIRVVTGTGLNFRLDPAGGEAVDARPAAGDPAGAQPDADLTGLPGGSTGATAAAYSDSFGGALGTVLFVLDAAGNSLFVQGADPDGPDGGALSRQVLVNVDGAALDFTAVNGFDIPAGVRTDAAGAVAGRAFAVLTVDNDTGLYTIDLATGAAVEVGPTGTVGAAGLAVGDAPVGTVGFELVGGTVAEDGTAVDVVIRRTAGSTGAFTVALSVGGTAAPGQDYTAPAAVVEFADGQLARTVTIPITDDALDEDDETIVVTLRDPTNGAVLGAATETELTLTDNDEGGQIVFQSATYTATEDGGPATITLARTGGVAGGVTVTVTPTAGTATAGDDFDPAPVTVTFAAGSATATAPIPLAADNLDELNETVNLTLSNPQGGATLGQQAAAVLTVTDDDEPGQIAVSSVAAVGEAGNAFTVTLTRTGGSDGEVAVTLGTGGTAAPGTDYTLPAGSGTITFGDTVTTRTVLVTVVNDDLDEADETAVFTLSSPTNGATLGAATATTTITDDDVGGVIQFSQAAQTVGEGGGAVTVTLTRTGGAAGPVTVTLGVGGTATPNQDFTPPVSATVQFNPNDTQAFVTLTVADDILDEDNETIVLTLSNPAGGATLGATTTQTVTVTDNDGPGVFAFQNATFGLTEGGAAVPVVITRTDGTTGAVELTVTATGTADNGADFTFAPTTVSFAAGQTTAAVPLTVTPLQDGVFEGNESVVLTLSAPTGGGTLGQQAATTGTITDDEPAPAAGALTFDAAGVSFDENGGQVAVTVRRVGGTAGAVTATLTATGTAAAGQDFAAPPTTVTFADGDAEETVTIPVINDDDIEPAETLVLTLSAPTGGAQLGNRDDTTVTIVDNDAPGAVAFTGATFTGGEAAGSVNLTFTRTGGTGGEVSVTLARTGGTATLGADFTAPAATVTFAPGASTATVAVPLLNDTEPESAETVELAISAPTGGAALGAQTTATLTITDDGDVAPPAAGAVAFGAATFTVAEGGGSLAVPLTRTGGAAGAVTVTVAVTGGTAGAGDIGPVPATVTFADGATAATLVIPVTADTLDEADETVVLTLSAPTGGATLGAQSTAAVTVTDDDATAADNLVTVGGQPGGVSQTYRVGADGTLTAVGPAVTPFPGFAGVVRSTTGDFNGDGVLDTVYVTGPGTPLRYTVVSGAAGRPVLVQPTAPFSGSEGFAGGGFVAAADFDRDGRAEWAVTPDQGGGPRVTVFSLIGATNALTVRANFLGIDDANFRGGARPAAGDVNGDGTPDLAVAAGFLGGPRTALFNGATLLTGTPARLTADFFAFPGEDATRLRNGAFVAAGDVTGDGFGDLVFGGGPGGAPRVFILDGRQVSAGQVGAAQTAPIANFFVAGNTADRGGARVATADADGDGRAEVVVGSGAGSPARVRTYPGSGFVPGLSGEPIGFRDLTPFGGAVLTDGVFVG